MAQDVIQIQLTHEERRIILQYGYLLDRKLETKLQSAQSKHGICKVKIDSFHLRHLIGELSRSYNHDEATSAGDDDELLELCERLEAVERTGDGQLDIFI